MFEAYLNSIAKSYENKVSKEELDIAVSKAEEVMASMVEGGFMPLNLKITRDFLNKVIAGFEEMFAPADEEQLQEDFI